MTGEKKIARSFGKNPSQRDFNAGQEVVIYFFRGRIRELEVRKGIVINNDSVRRTSNGVESALEMRVKSMGFCKITPEENPQEPRTWCGTNYVTKITYRNMAYFTQAE